MTLWLDDGDVRLYAGDALDCLREMPSESVQCIVTSPPFFSLRDYGMPGQIGLEETPEAWSDALVSVFREARRVLRSDGVMWLEVGDTYNTHPAGNTKPRAEQGNGSDRFNVTGGQGQDAQHEAGRNRARIAGRKEKDLVGAPWLLAFALRADGWYLRSDTIWARPNPMPESVTDRPTKAHSYVFLLTKSARYFYDADAIREPHDDKASFERFGKIGKQGGYNAETAGNANVAGARNSTIATKPGGREYNPAGRNARSVWSIPTEPTPFAHFATFPQALVERCIKAGTSEHGACSECGAPWRRITERTLTPHQKTWNHRGDNDGHVMAAGRKATGHMPSTVSVETVGWEPGCRCNDCPDCEGAGAVLSLAVENVTNCSACNGTGEIASPIGVVPCRVLDPFMGSGTTALVARRLGRHAIGIELNAEYAAIAAERLSQLSLLA